MYKSNNVAERIKHIAKLKGIPVNKMLEDIDLGRNTMSNFKTSMPKADNLAKIADYLGCSVDYLLGRTEEKNAPVAPKYDEGEWALIELYRRLPEHQRDLVLQMVKAALGLSE